MYNYTFHLVELWLIDVFLDNTGALWHIGGVLLASIHCWLWSFHWIFLCQERD